MSLTLLAARVAAIEALRGQTWAGDLVFDGAGDIPASDANAPRFSIVVDSGGVHHNQASLILTLSLLQRLPVTQEVTDPQTGNTAVETIGVAWQVPYTSPAAECVLDCFATAVMRKLVDASLPWSAAFAGLASNVKVRTVQANGAAQRILAVDFDVGAAPVDRAEVKGGWSLFLAEIEADKHAMAPLFAYMIPAAKPPALDWAAFGIDCGILLAPLPPVASVAAKPEKARVQPKKKAKATA